jgi:hypothetical protein
MLAAVLADEEMSVIIECYLKGHLNPLVGHKEHSAIF